MKIRKDENIVVDFLTWFVFYSSGLLLTRWGGLRYILISFIKDMMRMIVVFG